MEEESDETLDYGLEDIQEACPFCQSKENMREINATLTQENGNILSKGIVIICEDCGKAWCNI